MGKLKNIRKTHCGRQKRIHVEGYVKSVQAQESVRLLFSLRTVSTGLLEDRKKCIMVSDVRCVMCDSRVGEDAAHFQMSCREFVRDWPVLLDNVYRIVGA